MSNMTTSLQEKEHNRRGEVACSVLHMNNHGPGTQIQVTLDARFHCARSGHQAKAVVDHCMYEMHWSRRQVRPFVPQVLDAPLTFLAFRLVEASGLLSLIGGIFKSFVRGEENSFQSRE